MARITEPMKIEKIKKAVMAIMCEHGFSNLSIASISEVSGVSSGYLYRYYNGKDELVQDIIISTMDEMKNKVIYDIKLCNTVYDFFLKMIARIFEITNADPVVGRFLAKLVQELNQPSWMEDHKNNQMYIWEEIICLGRKTGELSLQVTISDLDLVLSLPFRYIEMELSKNKYKKFTEEEVIKITNICLKAIG